MAGFGNTNFGVMPYGPGTPATAAETPDPPVGAKFINFLTKDYERDATGAFKRMPRTTHRVYMALGTALTSATGAPDFGAIFPDKIDESYERKVRNEVTRALFSMTSAGEIRIDSVVVEQTQTGRVQHTVAFTGADGTEDRVTR